MLCDDAESNTNNNRSDKMTIDLLVLSAAVVALIGSALGFPFALVSLLGDWIVLVGGAGAVAAAGFSLLGAILVVITACGVAVPLMG